MILLDTLSEFRPNVGICLLNKAGKVWIGKRSIPKQSDPDLTFAWQMPQGGIDQGETPEAAAIRELYEETGVRSAQILTLTPGWLAYDFPSHYKSKKKRNWRGQRQKWAIMLFTGDDSEIDLTAHEEQEFNAWRWADADTIVDLVVPFKRELYTEVLSTIAPLAAYVRAHHKA